MLVFHRTRRRALLQPTLVVVTDRLLPSKFRRQVAAARLLPRSFRYAGRSSCSGGHMRASGSRRDGRTVRQRHPRNVPRGSPKITEVIAAAGSNYGRVEPELAIKQDENWPSSRKGRLMPLDHYVTLGRSGLRVSPLCLGAMILGTVAHLKTAWALGVRSVRFATHCTDADTPPNTSTRRANSVWTFHGSSCCRIWRRPRNWPARRS
jgi:hypothetical protein